MSAAAMKAWIKSRETPLSRFAYCAFTTLKTLRVPVIRPLHRTLYALHLAVRHAVQESARILWYTPLFASRLETPAPGLLLYSGMPQVIGPLRIRVGRGSRISGISTFIGRSGTRRPAAGYRRQCRYRLAEHDLRRHQDRNRRQCPPRRQVHAGGLPRAPDGPRGPRRRPARHGRPDWRHRAGARCLAGDGRDGPGGRAHRRRHGGRQPAAWSRATCRRASWRPECPARVIRSLAAADAAA